METKKNAVAVLLLAGRGNRLFDDIHEKKQFYKIQGKELFLYALESLLKPGFFRKIILVIEKEDEGRVTEILKKESLPEGLEVSFAYGGKDRNESVYNALLSLQEEEGDFPVFLHDADRPLIKEEVLNTLYEESFRYEALTTALPIHDSLLKEKEGEITYIDRNNLYQVQTPQVFSYRKILKIYSEGYDPRDTDDFKKAVRAGLSFHVVRGNILSFKVTEKDDLELLETVIKSQF